MKLKPTMKNRMKKVTKTMRILKRERKHNAQRLQRKMKKPMKTIKSEQKELQQQE